MDGGTEKWGLSKPRKKKSREGSARTQKGPYVHKLKQKEEED